jgi:hypothetical protein
MPERLNGVEAYEAQGMTRDEAIRAFRFDKAPEHVIDYLMGLEDRDVARDAFEEFVSDLWKRFDDGQRLNTVLAQFPTDPTEH